MPSVPRTSAALVLLFAIAAAAAADPRPFVDGRFQGRIAYSCDGNHNDPDDWIASPVALAIFAEAGLRDHVVHFDYNSILPQTNPAWEKLHAESVLGTVQRYGYDAAKFFDDRRDVDGAIASIVRAINASSAGDPLYFIIAGPMEVPFRALQKSDPAKLQHVYCISHSRWNDGFARGYQFSFNKRSVIEQGVHWIQIRDQNRLLSFGRFGTPAKPEEFAPYFWMRDARDPIVRWLWERMLVSTRPDPSDAGMAWFLATGDEECTPARLAGLLGRHEPPARRAARDTVRIEAENFRHLEGMAIEDTNDRLASHRLAVKPVDAAAHRLRTRFDEPFARPGRYDIEVRYAATAAGGAPPRLALLINGAAVGAAWTADPAQRGWVSRTIAGVPIALGDELRIDVTGANARVDFVQLNPPDAAVAPPAPRR